ncbi:MAG: DUF402 domain-containing protein [Dehalococcoidia bacterium]
MARHREPGESVVMRHVRGEWVWAVAATVVEDSGGFVALYVQPGNGMSRMGDADGQPTRAYVEATTRVPGAWADHHQLMLIREGDRHAVQLYWTEREWELRCWYINFQEPLGRFSLGFESMDLTLDVVIEPGLERWTWKDEDEFAYGIEGGWYTPALLADLKAYGEAVLGDVAARRPPFDQPWDTWRPDPAWRPVLLPDGWDAEVDRSLTLPASFPGAAGP